jgi:hypothetical protein
MGLKSELGCGGQAALGGSYAAWAAWTGQGAASGGSGGASEAGLTTQRRCPARLGIRVR